MKWVYAGIAMLAGAGLACQVGCNSMLRSRFGHPIPAAATNFLVGFLALLATGLALGIAPPGAREAAGVPWWAWLGGLIGAGYVGGSAAFATRLGAAGWLGAVVAGQIGASLLIDHFGLLGFPARPLDLPRVVGIFLLLAGMALVLRH